MITVVGDGPKSVLTHNHYSDDDDDDDGGDDY